MKLFILKMTIQRTYTLFIKVKLSFQNLLSTQLIQINTISKPNHTLNRENRHKKRLKVIVKNFLCCVHHLILEMKKSFSRNQSDIIWRKCFLQLQKYGYLTVNNFFPFSKSSTFSRTSKINAYPTRN